MKGARAVPGRSGAARLVLAVAGVAVLLFVLGAAAGRAAGAASPLVEAAGPCRRCHERETLGWAGSVHAQQRVTCPICHGSAPRHVESGGRSRDVRAPRRLPYEAGVYLCGRCHDLRQFRRSSHYQIKVLDCFSCHQAHAFAPAQGTLSFCGVTGCHPDIARGAQGHRNRLARASCAGCHLPVTTDLRTGQSGTNHTLRPALAREALHRLPVFGKTGP